MNTSITTGLTGFWTITVWIDEAATRDYLRERPHRAAMPRLRVRCDEASVVHWRQDTGELPTVAEALDHMVNQGRPSKVNRSSPAQGDGRLAPSGRAPEFGPVLTPHSHAASAVDPESRSQHGLRLDLGRLGSSR